MKLSAEHLSTKTQPLQSESGVEEDKILPRMEECAQPGIKCKKKHKSMSQPQQAQVSFSHPHLCQVRLGRWYIKIQLLCSLRTSTSALGTKHFPLLRIEANQMDVSVKFSTVNEDQK